MDEFLQNGCNCVVVENRSNISMSDICDLFKGCPHECQPVRHLVIDGQHLFVLPSCIGSLL